MTSKKLKKLQEINETINDAILKLETYIFIEKIDNIQFNMNNNSK